MLHYSLFFFFNDTATTEIYTLSLHDALPIYRIFEMLDCVFDRTDGGVGGVRDFRGRSEEHTSELQSLTNLVCRLLLEKKKKTRPRRPQRQAGPPPQPLRGRWRHSLRARSWAY